MNATRKLRALLTGAALCVALAVAVSFWTFGEIAQAAESRAHTTFVLDRTSDLLSALRDAETGQRGYALTGDEKFLEPYLAVHGTIPRQWEELRQLTTIPAARQHLDAMGPTLDEKMAEMAQVIALRRVPDTAAMLGRIGAGEGKRLMNSIRGEMNAFRAIEETAQAGHEAQFQADMRRLFAIMAVGSLFVLLLALSFAFSLNREAEHRVHEETLRGTKNLLEIQNGANHELQQANERLEASEEKLSVTLRSIGDGMIATDATGRVTLLNPVAEKLTGWTLAEARGSPVENVFKSSTGIRDRRWQSRSALRWIVAWSRGWPVRRCWSAGTAGSARSPTVARRFGIARDGRLGRCSSSATSRPSRRRRRPVGTVPR